MARLRAKLTTNGTGTVEVIDTSKEKLYTLPKVQDWSDSNAQHAPDFGLVHSQQKGKFKMGSLKGGEPKKKAPKKKAGAKKKAAKK